ncbi:MAG: hypothetical protein PH343_08245 [Nitrospira sp.]|nr:hypothetical protein [Nitrospira sp.]
MKKILYIIIISIFPTSGLFATNEVQSANIVGYNRVTIPSNGQLAMVSMQFDGIGATNTFFDVFGTNQLIKNNSNPSSADRIYQYDTVSSTYKIYYQRASNNFFYQTGNNVPTNPVLEAGDAFWIRSPSSATSNRELVVLGEVVVAPVINMGMVSNMNMISYPFTSDIGLNELGFSNSVGSARNNSNPSSADRIYIYQNGSYKIYGLKTGGWTATSPGSYSTNPPTTDRISMGQGFWYRAVSNNWTWVETNRYLSAIQ